MEDLDRLRNQLIGLEVESCWVIDRDFLVALVLSDATLLYHSLAIPSATKPWADEAIGPITEVVVVAPDTGSGYNLMVRVGAGTLGFKTRNLDVFHIAKEPFYGDVEWVNLNEVTAPAWGA